MTQSMLASSDSNEVNRPRRTRAIGACALLAVALWACSSSTPQQTEPEVTAEPTSAPPEVTAEPTSAPTAEPTSAPTAEPTATGPKSSGRPPMTAEGKDKVTGTFGQTPAAKLTITADQSVFRIPEFALNDGILVTFMIDKKPPKKAKGGIGTVYRVMAQRPPAEETSTVSSAGPKFTIKVPTGKNASANLAVGEIGKDDKGKETVTWKVVAPAQKEEGFATFELADFGNTMLQVTSEAPAP
ncbi:MAG: hypothetical protein HOW73_17405 [Polyangiaceae bacterium]|nr:hypothetical protein [Polyangiaceae bacterium]